MVEAVESEVKELVNAQITVDDERIAIQNPTETEVKKLSDYTHSSESISGQALPREEKIVLEITEGDV